MIKHMNQYSSKLYVRCKRVNKIKTKTWHRLVPLHLPQPWQGFSAEIQINFGTDSYLHVKEHFFTYLLFNINLSVLTYN